jgi:large subunit ribosomal protein L6
MVFMAGVMVKKIKVPEEVRVTVQGPKVTLKGPRGELSKEFKSHRIKLTNEGNIIKIEGTPKNQQTDILVETTAAHIRNMSEGLLFGYEYKMKVVYSHFPMSLVVDKGIVNIKNFLGEKFPRKAQVVGSTKVEVKGQDITVSGIDKDAVGQTASNIEKKTKVKNKDIRRYQDGVFVTEMGNITERTKPPIEIVREKE